MSHWDITTEWERGEWITISNGTVTSDANGDDEKKSLFCLWVCLQCCAAKWQNQQPVIQNIYTHYFAIIIIIICITNVHKSFNLVYFCISEFTVLWLLCYSSMLTVIQTFIQTQHASAYSHWTQTHDEINFFGVFVPLLVLYCMFHFISFCSFGFFSLWFLFRFVWSTLDVVGLKLF